ARPSRAPTQAATQARWLGRSHQNMRRFTAVSRTFPSKVESSMRQGRRPVDHHSPVMKPAGDFVPTNLRRFPYRARPEYFSTLSGGIDLPSKSLSTGGVCGSDV